MGKPPKTDRPKLKVKPKPSPRALDAVSLGSRKLNWVRFAKDDSRPSGSSIRRGRGGLDWGDQGRPVGANGRPVHLMLSWSGRSEGPLRREGHCEPADHVWMGPKRPRCHRS